MTYSAPELLLVGAAQSLVLGPDSTSPLCRLNSEDPENGSDFLIQW